METNNIYAQLRSDWSAIAHTPDSRRALAALAKREHRIDRLGLADLGDLVDRVHSGRPYSLPAVTAAAVIAATLRSADAHPHLRRLLVQLLYPGLNRVVGSLGSLVRMWESYDNCYYEAVLVLWEVVDGWAGDERPWAVRDIQSAVRSRLRRQAMAARAEHQRMAQVAMTEVAAGGDRSDLEELAAVLRDAATLGIERDEAAVVCLTRVYGFTLKEVATLTGTTSRQLQVRRNRAERCLVA